MKRLLLDVTTITDDMTGVSRYGIELIKVIISSSEIALSLITNTNLSPDHEIFKLIENKSIIVHKLNVKGIGPAREWRFLKLSWELADKFDVFHSITSNAPFAFFYKGVGTFHDLKYVLYPHYMGKFGVLKSNFIRIQFGFICFFYKKITCSSQSTLNDLVKVFPWMKDKILEKTQVVYLGLTPLKVEPLSKSFPVDQPYFIYVGELRPHKNILKMIQSFELFAKKTNFQGRFLIGGKPHKTFDIKPTDPRVIFLDRVEDQDLGSLYANSIALFFASRYEGFGLPILEALNLNVPVITSSISSMPEVAGEAGIIVDPDNLTAMADALELLAFNPEKRSALIEKGKKQSLNFSWNKCGKEMISVYLKVNY
jgi:glycosyltransferase involved in cell wall biosynthesis